MSASPIGSFRDGARFLAEHDELVGLGARPETVQLFWRLALLGGLMGMAFTWSEAFR